MLLVKSRSTSDSSRKARDIDVEGGLDDGVIAIEDHETQYTLVRAVRLFDGALRLNFHACFLLCCFEFVRSFVRRLSRTHS